MSNLFNLIKNVLFYAEWKQIYLFKIVCIVVKGSVKKEESMFLFIYLIIEDMQFTYKIYFH